MVIISKKFIAQFLKVEPSGGRIYYPWGAYWSSGYVVETEKQYKQIICAINLMFGVLPTTLVIILVASGIKSQEDVGMLIDVVLLVLGYLCYFLFTKKIAKELSES